MKDIRNILQPQIVQANSDIILSEGKFYDYTIPNRIHPCLWQYGDHS